MSIKSLELKRTKIEKFQILNSVCIESKGYWNYPKAWIDKWRDDLTLSVNDFASQNIYHIELCGNIVGYCSIKEWASEYEITNLWVRPKYIGKGFGKYLLNGTIKKVVNKNKTIKVEADPNAERFYQSQGFKTYGKIESYPKGRFLPVMKKTIYRD